MAFRPISAMTTTKHLKGRSNSTKKFSKTSLNTPKQLSCSSSMSNFPLLINFNSTNESSAFSLCKTFNKKIDQKALYEETLQLKREVNKLKRQIYLEKTDKRKKEVDYMRKEKAIEDVLENIKTSSKVKTNPELMDKLKGTNELSIYKKEFKDLKQIYFQQINLSDMIKRKIKAAKISNEKFFIIKSKEELERLVNKYRQINSTNEMNHNQISQMGKLRLEFINNHKNIEYLKNELDNKRIIIDRLQRKLDNLGNKSVKNKETKTKNNLEITKVNLENKALLNEKKYKEEAVKTKDTYELEIENLLIQERKGKGEIEKYIGIKKDLNKEIEDIESLMKIDRQKLRIFKFSNIKTFERDPKLNKNPKILLLNSLIDESKQNRSKYRKKIKDLKFQLKSLGIQCTEENIPLDDFNFEENNNNNNNNVNNNIIDDSDINNIKENFDFVNNDSPPISDKSNKSNRSNKKKFSTNNSLNLNQIQNNYEDDQTNKKRNFNNNDKEKKTTPEIMSDDNNNQKDNNIQDENSLANEDFSELSFLIITQLGAKKINSELAYEKIINNLLNNNSKEDFNNIPKNKFINDILNNLYNLLEINEESKDKIKQWLISLMLSSKDDQKETIQILQSLLNNIKIYSTEEEISLSKKVKKCFLPYDIQKKLKINSNKNNQNNFVTISEIKKLIKDENIKIKQEIIQFLFYKMKDYPEKNKSIYDLKINALFDILNNKEYDSKMNSDTDGDIEISNEEYLNVLSNFISNLSKILKEKKLTVREAFSKCIQTAKDDLTNEKFDVITLEEFVNQLKVLGITLKNEIEIYCIFSRYKISEDYEVIGVDFLETELQNYNKNQSTIFEDNNKIKGKVVEKVEEENESNL